MMPVELYWREAAWLWAMLLPPGVWLLAQLQRRRTWARIVDPALRPWVEVPDEGGRQRIGRNALVIAWLLLCVALAGPRTPRWIPPAVQQDAALVAVVDLSASMAAADVRPDRRRHAQALLADWTARMPDALRFGLVVYAGHAHRVLRPTADHDLARHFVRELDGIAPPTLGNALADALHLADEALTGAAAGRRHLLLITDGDLGGDAQQAAVAMGRGLQSAGVRLHVVGVGGAEAVGVPLPGGDALVVDGERIVSRREAGWLQRLAAGAGGRYHAAEAVAGKPLERVLGLPAPRIDPADHHRVLWTEWFGVPLLGGILVLLTVLHRTGPVNPAGGSTGAMLLVFLLGGCDGSLVGDPAGAEARAALDAGDHARARQLYAARDGHDARFAEGVACYRLADYPCALQAFALAAWEAPDNRARGRAAFNLGNTHFRLGDYREAAVLFAEAGALGVSPALSETNRAFADSLAATVRRHLADVAEALRRADWRAAAREMPEAMRDRVAEGIRLDERFAGSAAFSTLSADALRALVERGVTRSRGEPQTPGTPARHWVRSSGSATPHSTAGLLNRLLPMELGIPAAGRPYALEGQRQW